MGVIEGLSDEEACLVAILHDGSGLDLAEFAWYEAENPDGCWRAWPFQWRWWRDEESMQIDQCGRSVGKTLGIQARAFVFPFKHPGQEMVVTAPELVHLQPVTTAIERRFFESRLGREMMPRARGKITRRPFQMNFLTGSRILGRIPQVTGRGVKGLHPITLEMDEAQDYPDAGWTELIATLRRGVKGAIWRAHGVTRGIQDRFHEFTQPSPNNPWKVHRFTSVHTPTYSDEEREHNIALYGSREAPDYRRNILGLHGDATNPLFVLHRLMRLADSIEESEYNTSEYQRFMVRAEVLEERAGPAQEDQARAAMELLDFAERRYKTYWCGMDVGFTVDPSEILVFAEYLPSAAELALNRQYKQGVPEKGMTRLKLVARIHLERIANPTQAEIIRHVIRHFKPKAFGMDSTGNGLGLFQDVQATSLELAQVIKGYNFSSSVIVDIDGTIEVDYGGDVLKEAAITSNVLEFSTDKLRELVDNSRIFLPWDRDVLKEFQGQTWCSDTATEILTQRGWLSYDRVRVGDKTLALWDDAGTPVSRWTEIQAVNVFPSAEREVVAMRGQTHNSVTTANHRWLVKPYNHAKYLEWKTSAELCSDERRYRIPLTALRGDIPMQATYDDDFVELVAWYYTEGHRTAQGRVALSQSPTANPAMVERIEGMLVRMLGPGDIDPGRGRPGPGRWSRTSAKEERNVDQHGLPSHTYRVKDAGLSAAVLAVVLTEHKAVAPDFLTALTGSQLDLFIGVSEWADGCGFTRHREGRQDTVVRTFKQANEGRARSFELACALRGIPTHTTFVETKGEWRVSVLRRRYAHSTSLVRTPAVLDGIVWCPTTAAGTWLARRDGAVFFTGNSFSKALMDAYGRRRRVFSAGSFHNLDAARMAAMAHAQAAIEQFIKDAEGPGEPVYDYFMGDV